MTAKAHSPRASRATPPRGWRQLVDADHAVDGEIRGEYVAGGKHRLGGCLGRAPGVAQDESDLRGGEAAGGRGLGPRPIERCSSNCNSHFPARKMLSLASQSAFDHRSVSKVCAFFANVPVPDLFRLQAWIMAIWRSRSNENALVFAALTPLGVRIPGFRADIEVVRHSTRCRVVAPEFRDCSASSSLPVCRAGHTTTRENTSAKLHMAMATAEVHFAKVR